MTDDLQIATDRFKTVSCCQNL